jgi:hypothetical protein
MQHHRFNCINMIVICVFVISIYIHSLASVYRPRYRHRLGCIGVMSVTSSSSTGVVDTGADLDLVSDTLGGAIVYSLVGILIFVTSWQVVLRRCITPTAAAAH